MTELTCFFQSLKRDQKTQIVCENTDKPNDLEPVFVTHRPTVPHLQSA